MADHATPERWDGTVDGDGPTGPTEVETVKSCDIDGGVVFYDAKNPLVWVETSSSVYLDNYAWLSRNGYFFSARRLDANVTDDERCGGTATDVAGEDDDAERPSAGMTSEIDPEERWDDPEARWDPETRWGNSEKNLPTIPHVDIPDEDAGDDTLEFSPNVNPEAARLFQASVALTNVDLAELAVRLMLVYFRGDTLLGGGPFLFDAVVLVRVHSIYRESKRGEWRDGDNDDSDGDDADDGDSAKSDDTSGTDDEREDTPERNR